MCKKKPSLETVMVTNLNDNELFLLHKFLHNPILLSQRLPPCARLGHTPFSCVGRYTDLVGCFLVPVAVGQGAP